MIIARLSHTISSGFNRAGGMLKKIEGVEYKPNYGSGGVLTCTFGKRLFSTKKSIIAKKMYFFSFDHTVLLKIELHFRK